jgi:hypothetical protein
MPKPGSKSAQVASAEKKISNSAERAKSASVNNKSKNRNLTFSGNPIKNESKKKIRAKRNLATKTQKNADKWAHYADAFVDPKSFVKYWRQDTEFRNLIIRNWGDMWTGGVSGVKVAFPDDSKEMLLKRWGTKCDKTTIKPGVLKDVPHGKHSPNSVCCSLFKNGQFGRVHTSDKVIDKDVVRGEGRLCGWTKLANEEKFTPSTFPTSGGRRTRKLRR